jgi:hypothetical protein
MLAAYRGKESVKEKGHSIMNKVTRTLAMTGIAMAAGLTVGVGPASASPAGPAPSAPTADHKFKKDKLVGFYRSPRACVQAGELGERRHKWDDYDCDRVQRGVRRGWFSLTASWDQRGGPWGHHGSHAGPGDHGPRR